MSRPGQDPRRGDSGAILDALSRKYRPVLIRYFRRRGVDEADAQDLVQEVFGRLARPRLLAQVERVEGYLFVTAANLSTEYFRRKGVRNANQLDDHKESFQRTGEFAPDRLLESRRELEDMVAALNEMPERMRHIFVLARIENLPRAEIAAGLGVSKRLVEQQITLATACLADRRRRAR